MKDTDSIRNLQIPLASKRLFGWKYSLSLFLLVVFVTFMVESVYPVHLNPMILVLYSVLTPICLGAILSYGYDYAMTVVYSLSSVLIGFTNKGYVLYKNIVLEELYGEKYIVRNLDNTELTIYPCGTSAIDIVEGGMVVTTVFVRDLTEMEGAVLEPDMSKAEFDVVEEIADLSEYDDFDEDGPDFIDFL